VSVKKGILNLLGEHFAVVLKNFLFYVHSIMVLWNAHAPIAAVTSKLLTFISYNANRRLL